LVDLNKHQFKNDNFHFKSYTLLPTPNAVSWRSYEDNSLITKTVHLLYYYSQHINTTNYICSITAAIYIILFYINSTWQNNIQSHSRYIPIINFEVPRSSQTLAINIKTKRKEYTYTTNI